MDEGSTDTLTHNRGYRNPEHESVRQTRVSGSHSRPLSACRSSAPAAHPEEFCATCGYHRKSALRLLNRPLRTAPIKRPGPKIIYEPAEVLPVLKAIWLASDQLCSKLLAAALPQWLEHYQRRYAPLSEAFKEKFLGISPAQIDRLLRPVRVQHPKKDSAPPDRARCCVTPCRRAAGRPTRAVPAPSRPTRSPIATIRPKATMFIR